MGTNESRYIFNRKEIMKLDYFVFGTNDMDAAMKFYDSLFENTELKRVLSTDRMIFWQCEDFAFALAKPFNKKARSWLRCHSGPPGCGWRSVRLGRGSLQC